MPSSGAGGPCDHCGRTQTCCWRRGPPEKPILCNACGARFLVKKNLDGYVPIVQRPSVGSRSPKQAKAKKPTAILRGRTTKPKRNRTKRVLDADTWFSDLSEDEESRTTDDSESGMTTQSLKEATKTRRENNRPSLLGDASRSQSVLHIASHSQLQALGNQQFIQEFQKAVNSTLRMKPRKPLNPTITAVF